MYAVRQIGGLIYPMTEEQWRKGEDLVRAAYLRIGREITREQARQALTMFLEKEEKRTLQGEGSGEKPKGLICRK